MCLMSKSVKVSVVTARALQSVKISELRGRRGFARHYLGTASHVFMVLRAASIA